MKMKGRFIILVSILILSACSQPVEVDIWLSCSDQSALLNKQESFQMVPDKDTEQGLTIREDQTYQEMAGFGASFTESSGYSLSFLPEKELNRVMNELFDPKTGIGITILRQPMGSSDFALSTYSYDDMPPGETDFELNHFSIEKDRQYILPYLKQALEVNPELKIMASPWSPPAWMRTGESMIGGKGGTLRRDCYQVYALYFVKFIKAYAKEGIPVFALTIQNEPNYAPASYAGMRFTPEEEALFIGHYLGPALEEAGLDVKIICYDHNWDRPDLALGTLSDRDASPYLNGSAWHYYGGSPAAMLQVHEAFPDKEIWFTEGSTGKWIGRGSFTATFDHGMEQALGIVNHWSKSIIWWNVALDENNGPIVYPNTSNYGLVHIDTEKRQRVLPNRASWYSLGHFSKFILPGARRVNVDPGDVKISHAAFQNPDGSLVLVAYNRFFSHYKLKINWNGNSFSFDLPARSAISCIWDI